jgi:hypothetical protein
MFRNTLIDLIDYADIDFEIRDLCKVLNLIDGVETIESCCGHGTKPCMILFKVEDIPTLNNLLHYCFNHERKWKIYADMADPTLNSDYLRLVLTTGDVYDEYFVSTMVENLTNRLKECKERMNNKE